MTSDRVLVNVEPDTALRYRVTLYVSHALLAGDARLVADLLYADMCAAIAALKGSKQ